MYIVFIFDLFSMRFGKLHENSLSLSLSLFPFSFAHTHIYVPFKISHLIKIVLNECNNKTTLTSHIHSHSRTHTPMHTTTTNQNANIIFEFISNFKEISNKKTFNKWNAWHFINRIKNEFQATNQLKNSKQTNLNLLHSRNNIYVFIYLL